MSEQLLRQILDTLRQMDARLNQVESNVEQFKTEQQNTNLRLDRIESDIGEIKQSVHRIELGQPEDIKAMLQTIYDKLDERNSEIQVLNRRVFKVESAVERLSGQ